jgi:hypothetical protein
MFSLISSITQQQQQSATSFGKQSTNQKPINPSSIKKPPVLLQRVFISSGKQGGGAAVLGEGCDILTRNLLHLASPLFKFS